MNLVKNNGNADLIWSSGPTGPPGVGFNILASRFDGTNWSTPMEVAPHQDRRELLVLSGASTAEILTVETVTQFGFSFETSTRYSWDGESVTGPVNENAIGPVSEMAGYTASDGTLVLATHSPLRGMEHHTMAVDQTSFSRSGGFTLTAQPSELIFVPIPESSTSWLVWTELTASARRIFYAIIGEDGVVIRGPEELTGNIRGYYSQISLATGDGNGARVSALFENGSSQIRTFVLDPEAGTGGNDADNDQLNDIDELRIIDHDNGDALKLITDITPQDDFDGDGFSNLDEIAGKSDATDPSSVPEGIGFDPTIRKKIEWWQDPETSKHYLQIRFSQPSGAEGGEVIVESAGQLTGWKSGEGHTVDRTPAVPELDLNGNPIRIVRDAAAREDARKRFLRLRLNTRK
ncbi:MAG: hypothetical protein AAF514_13535 [Verrucomicrobiota bacterium]